MPNFWALIAENGMFFTQKSNPEGCFFIIQRMLQL